MINKLMHARNGIPPRSPIDAYRMIHEADKAYDKTVLVEYIQLYGLYPIGSLAKFSGGFLVWVMDIDGKGMPCQVHVVKNLSFPDTNISSVLDKSDFLQIGKLEDARSDFMQVLEIAPPESPTALQAQSKLEALENK